MEINTEVVKYTKENITINNDIQKKIENKYNNKQTLKTISGYKICKEPKCNHCSTDLKTYATKCNMLDGKTCITCNKPIIDILWEMAVKYCSKFGVEACQFIVCILCNSEHTKIKRKR